jgi:DNA-binding LacI/PurR family transcriptional regulator
MGTRRTTLHDVARAAGVSKTTVSHVLSGNRPVSVETRARVGQVIKDLGFRPNYFAQSLNARPTATVALLVDDLTNPHYPALARGVQSVMAPSGRVVLLFDAGADPALTSRFLTTIHERKVDAIIAASDVAAHEMRRLTEDGVVTVLVSASAPQDAVDRVIVDDRAIGFDSTMRVLAAGHQRVTFLGLDAGKAPGDLRWQGYLDAMNAAGNAPAHVTLDGDWTRAGGRRAVRRLLEDRGDRPTAFVCANDLIAVGALDAARELQMSVPRDLAVIGVDDIDAAAMTTPALTTIRIPSEQIGRRAGELVLRRLEDRSIPVSTVVLGHELVDRDSV